MLRVWCVLAFVVTASAAAQSPSPYAGQQLRDIKALSAQEISDYSGGRGTGLAKAAELNGYPGPAHVLEMAGELHLTAQQKADTEALFGRMQARAIALGKQLVDEERALDASFASHAVTPDALAKSLSRIAALSGELRRVHLEAHLEQTALLRPEQVMHYNELRGYGAADTSAPHQHGMH